MITSTLTTLAAFIPLVFGQECLEIYGYLPITVIVSLTCSLLVAFFVNPVIGSKMMKVSKNKE